MSRIRAEDMGTIRAADQSLKAAKRALRLARAKRERRVARIDAVMKAFQEATRGVRAAEADLEVAQREYDQAFTRAAENVLRDADRRSNAGPD
jgi:hypothetical protein